MYASLVFLLTLGLSLFFTDLVRRYALSRRIVDVPDIERKIHKQATPLLGGVAIYVSFTVVVLFLAFATQVLIGKDVSLKAVIGLTLAGFVLMIGGYLDDKFRLPPRAQIMWPILATIIIIMVGVGVKVITNPAGGLLDLEFLKIEILRFGGVPYYFTVVADIFTFLWLMGMMYTTKLLDGLDGLASGIGVIGSLIIFGLTQFTPFYQPTVGLLALVLAGAAAGFLWWNWHPAKIFLGEGGSLYIGFVLGVLSIISGAKIATALLVMGIPILDVAWVIIRRLFWDKKKITQGDNKHLHYRLLDIGLSHRQAVLLLYILTGIFGFTSLFFRTTGKVISLSLLLAFMALLASGLVSVNKNTPITK